MGADADLDALNARVLAPLPRSSRASDGSWEMREVSTSLHAFHTSLKQQLAAQEAEFYQVTRKIQSLRADVRAESQAMQQQLDAATREIGGEIEPDIEAAQAHFGQVVALLEPATQRLQTLDARAKYLAMALEIERRSQQAKASAVEATAVALDAFQAFSAFVATIPSEYAALRREALRRVDELSFGIKQYAVEKLQHTLEAVEWPRARATDELEHENEKLRAIARAFAYLLTLHVSQQQAETPQKTDKTAELWAMECVLEPIRLRFRFHFERAESKTNRATKPEWWLSHVLEQTRAHAAFLSSVLTPELARHRDALDCADAQVLFLRGLVLTASKKLAKDLPAALTERAVFCHTIDEVLLFEQAVNDEFGYDSYASAKPASFPRVVDVLTADAKTLFAWTKIDAEYAQHTLGSEILGGKHAWATTTTTTETSVPPAAHQFVALLDFMCRRFAHFSNDGHRYVYISQVHFVLLHDFQRACAKRAAHVDARSLVEGLRPLAGAFTVVNAAQHVVHVLEAWDENPFFIELMRKVAESDKSRTQILKMHLEHSTAMLTNAAKAATETIMAREEAVAVRQAIAGPGAMIGPTAAFSAAYSVGSKTVKSLFGRSDEEATAVAAVVATASQEVTSGEEVVTGNAGAPTASEPTIDAETLLFSRTIFERQVREFKSLVASLIRDVELAVAALWKSALHRYRKSPHWLRESAPETIEPDVSSELGTAIVLLHQVLSDARRAFFSEDCFGQLWKPLVSSLDDAIFSAASIVLTPSPAPSSNPGFSLSSAATAIGAVEAYHDDGRDAVRQRRSWSTPARAQFLTDVKAVASVFQNCCTKNPRAYLRKTFDLCRLVEMPAAKLSEIHEALRDVDCDNGQSTMDQITTILEACNVLTLTPQQVQAFCEEQLGLQ